MGEGDVCDDDFREKRCSVGGQMSYIRRCSLTQVPPDRLFARHRKALHHIADANHHSSLPAGGNKSLDQKQLISYPPPAQ